MKQITQGLLSVAAFLLVAGTASAQTFTPQLSSVVGSGSKESFFTLDFQDGTADHNYAFGYLYDGTKTGADFLTALSSETALKVGSSSGSFGVFVTSFGFNGHSETGGKYSYWSYWKGTDGQSWSSSGVGASSRMLTGGSWDGWSWDTDYRNGPAPAPVTPAAVPEASSAISLSVLALLGLGALAVRRKKTA